MKFPYLLKLLYSGATPEMTKTELKKIKLFNAFCLMWGSVKVFFFFKYVFYNPFPSIFYVHSSFIVVIISAFLLHNKRFYTLAYIVFIIGLFLNSIIFAHFFFKNRLMELFMLFPCSVSLMLIDNRIINTLVFIGSYLGFIIPSYLLNSSVIDFTAPHISMLFFIIYGTALYFKNLNQKNEQALLISKKEVEAINQFQSQFFINISHEIRTPLTLINGYSDQIINKLGNPYNNSVKIKEQSKSIQKIVNDILDLAKMEAGMLKLNNKHISINFLLKRIFETHNIAFKNKNINFILKLNTNDVVVNADSLFLERALNNLLNNALKFTDANKTVRLESFVKNEHVFIQVIDEGIGISKEEKELVFNRFYQINNHINKSGGSGIGLAFTKEIIDLLKGEISVESSLNKGSCFTVKIPYISLISSEVKNEPIQVKTEQPKIDSSLKTNNAKILIVEDHKEMQNFIQQCLQHYNCELANDGVEALQKIKTQQYDLVITDYMMPNMDGYSLIKNIKKHNSLLPIIMLTARTEHHTKLKILQYGVNDYLTKPFDINELLARVNNILKNHKERITFLEEEKIAYKNSESDLIIEIKQFINSNLTIDFKTDDITENLHISKSSLQRNVKAETGLTVNQFIKEVKLTKARHLIENKKVKSVKEVAFNVGYSNPAYFSNQYLERFGCKPFK